MTITRTPPNATARRAWPRPPHGTTLHLIGDVHAGACPTWRYDALAADLDATPTPAATIQLGDSVENGTAAEKAVYATFRRRLSLPVYEAMGNHDTYVQTEAQWAAELGHPAANYTADVDDLRLIFIGGTEGQATPWSQIPPASLTWLDQQLASAGSRPCFIACHYPLWDTVGGDSSVEYNSRQGNFYATTAATTASSADILAVLAAHTNVKGWLSGHTHSSITAPGLVVPVVAGSQRFAHANASSMYYTGKGGGNGGPAHAVHSCYLTWTGEAVEVRYRHHGAGQWYGPSGTPVLSVTGLG